MSEFGGLLKHEKTYDVLVGLGSAAEFPERVNMVLKKKEKKEVCVSLSVCLDTIVKQ